eukprot:6200853-Pleurochrysis_carterae.AAC.1
MGQRKSPVKVRAGREEKGAAFSRPERCAFQENSAFMWKANVRQREFGIRDVDSCEERCLR